MRRVPLVTTILAATLTVLALAGCGSSSAGITENASTQLALRVQAVRNAAEARDRALAEARLADLRRSVADFRARDEISKTRADNVLAAAASVESHLQAIPTTTTTTTLPPTTREPDEDRPKRDNGDKGNRGGGGG